WRDTLGRGPRLWRQQGGDLRGPDLMAFAKEPEVLGHFALVAAGVRGRHRATIGRDFALILDVPSGKPVRLLEEKERGERVGRERRIEELLANGVETGAVGEHACPFSRGE